MKSDFSELGISDEIVKAIDEMGWTEPTPIQTEAIPYGIKGRDLLAQAQTGTGKTGTFGSIILNNIEAKNGWANALILTPTRELALQISEELDKLSKYTGHRNVTVYGGVSMLKQTQALDKGVDIIVATPGRLCDHLKDDERLLDDVSVVVLDEADRMLDMGFKKDLEFILERIPGEDIQTMLFSATMDPEIKKLAMKYLHDPKEVSVSKDEIVLDLIEQKYMAVEKDDKIDTLRYVLAKDPMKTIVFCFTKYRVDKVVRKLKMSFKLAGIHGEYSQNRREETLRKFKEDEIEVLIASDIAARGLDIENVERIINFDMPPEADTYVHRIGRTGRAGKNGMALSFIMKEDKKVVKEIENMTGIEIEKVKSPSRKEMDDVFSTIKELSRPVMAKKNSRKNDVPVKDKVFVIAEMNIGKVDGAGKADIAKTIQDNTDVPKKSIGNIFINDKTTTVEIEKKYLGKVENGLSKCDTFGKSIKIWKISEVEKNKDDIVEDIPEKKSEDENPKKKKNFEGRSFRRHDSERSRDRKPRHYTVEPLESEEERPRDRPPRSDDRRRSSDGRDRRSGDRRSFRRSDNSEHRERRSYGDKKPYRLRSDSGEHRERRSYGERKPYKSRSGDGEHRSGDRRLFRRSDSGEHRERRSYGDKKPYRSRSDGDRPPRSSDRDDRRSDYRPKKRLYRRRE